MIYFAQATEGDLIKIGHTSRLPDRLVDLCYEYATQFRVLGIMDGGREKESELHSRFAIDRDKGEFFRPSDAIMDCINSEAKQWEGGKTTRSGKKFLNIEIDPELRSAIFFAAKMEGKTMTEWFPEFLRRHLPKFECVEQS